MNTLTRKIGKYREIPTAEASYREGYHIGLTWEADWVPGGPFFHQANAWEKDNAEWVAFCEATVENNREWQRGWKDGVLAQLETVVHPDKYYPKYKPRPEGECNCGYHQLRAGK